MRTIALPMGLVTRLIDELQSYVILLNWERPDELADEIQFRRRSADENSGRRCRICDMLVSSDKQHKCW